METCSCCQKVETFGGQFYIGPCPYAEEMCVTQAERDELPDEVLCDDCYSNAVGDI